MMTAEFMLSKRPVLRFTAALFFLLKLCLVMQLLKYGTYMLRLSVRHGNTVSQFKINLKSHYFCLAFHDVHDL